MSDYFRPQSVQEASRLLRTEGDLTVLSGGTDLYPARTSQIAWGRQHPLRILDISAIDSLRGIEDRGSHWWIGATTTWTDIVRAPLPSVFDGLKAAAREIGGVQIQNRGTIAGNCCTASPAGDSIPCLLALDAALELVSDEGGVRSVPAAAFFTDYRATAVQKGELVVGIRIPKQRGRSAFLKLGARRYLVISIAMVAGVVDVDDQNRVVAARLAIGACSAVAQRLPALEATLCGKPLDASLVTPAHVAHLTPLDDIRASADYRRHAALELTRTLIASLAAQASLEAAHG